MSAAGGRPSVSAVVLTLDEERDLDRCLSSVAWCEERVVLDSGSRDRTPEIARRHGARFASAPWAGFANARNRALDLAAHDWVLALDADEWLADGSAQRIEHALGAPSADAFRLPRLNAWCGAVVRRAFGDDRVVRLVRRGTGRFVGGRLHDSWRAHPGARVASLDAVLMHLSYRTVEEYGARVARYAALAALDRAEAGRRFSIARLVLAPLGAFLRSLVVRGGVVDGTRGLAVAYGAAWYVALREAALWECERERDPDLTVLARPTPEDPDPAAPLSPGRSETGGEGR